MERALPDGGSWTGNGKDQGRNSRGPTASAAKMGLIPGIHNTRN